MDTGLSPSALSMMSAVFAQHAGIEKAVLYGSRAKGTWRPQSDIDLALVGDLPPLAAQAVALDLDELALPYLFDVKCYADVRHGPLRQHINRVGIVVYQRENAGEAGRRAGV